MKKPGSRTLQKPSSVWRLLLPSFYDSWAWLGGLAVAIPFLFCSCIKGGDYGYSFYGFPGRFLTAYSFPIVWRLDASTLILNLLCLLALILIATACTGRWLLPPMRRLRKEGRITPFVIIFLLGIVLLLSLANTDQSFDLPFNYDTHDFGCGNGELCPGLLFLNLLFAELMGLLSFGLAIRMFSWPKAP